MDGFFYFVGFYNNLFIMKKILLLFLVGATFVIGFAQPTPTADPTPTDGLGLSTLMGYNFNGKGDWANLAPEIFLGWTELMSSRGKVKIYLRVGPTISTIKSGGDTLDYYRSIMLPGNGSASILPYAEFKPSNDWTFIGATAGGVKVLTGITDTTNSIAQTNFRLGWGFQFKKLLGMTFQHTWASHNLTAESEGTYKRLFRQTTTKARYMTVTIQTYLVPLELFLYVNYRKFLTELEGVEPVNDRIISVGIRKDIDLLTGLHALR